MTLNCVDSKGTILSHTEIQKFLKLQCIFFEQMPLREGCLAAEAFCRNEKLTSFLKAVFHVGVPVVKRIFY